MNLLLKASQERQDFYDLIGTEVTFCNDTVSLGGQILHSKGEKAFISDVEYTPGFWSKMGWYVDPKINTFYINGITATCWIPKAFTEYQLKSNK